MAESSFTLPAALKLKPLQQGKLKLCGLYSGVNAIRLAIFPHQLTRCQEDELVEQGLEFLARQRKLLTVLNEGIPEPLWMRLTEHLINSSKQLHPTDIQIDRPLAALGRRDSELAVAELKEQLQRGSPLLVTLWGALNHSTVLVGYSTARFLLFDSAGYRWINISHLALAHSGRSARHKLAKRSAIALKSIF